MGLLDLFTGTALASAQAKLKQQALYDKMMEARALFQDRTSMEEQYLRGLLGSKGASQAVGEGMGAFPTTEAAQASVPATGLYSDDPRQVEITRAIAANFNPNAFQPAYTGTVMAPAEYQRALDVEQLKAAKEIAKQGMMTPGKEIVSYPTPQTERHQVYMPDHPNADPSTGLVDMGVRPVFAPPDPSKGDGRSDDHFPNLARTSIPPSLFASRYEMQVAEQRLAGGADEKSVYDSVVEGIKRRNATRTENSPTALNADIAAQDKAQAATLAIIKVKDTMERIGSFLEEAKPLIRWGTTGNVGRVTSALFKSSDASKLNQWLDPVRRQQILTTLQEMRAMSATGASGLGNTNTAEIQALEQSVANLDPGNSDPQVLLTQIEEIKRNYDRVYKSLQKDEEYKKGRANMLKWGASSVERAGGYVVEEEGGP